MTREIEMTYPTTINLFFHSEDDSLSYLDGDPVEVGWFWEVDRGGIPADDLDPHGPHASAEEAHQSAMLHYDDVQLTKGAREALSS